MMTLSHRALSRNRPHVLLVAVTADGINSTPLPGVNELVSYEWTRPRNQSSSNQLIFAVSKYEMNSMCACVANVWPVRRKSSSRGHICPCFAVIEICFVLISVGINEYLKTKPRSFQLRLIAFPLTLRSTSCIIPDVVPSSSKAQTSLPLHTSFPTVRRANPVDAGSRITERVPIF